MSGRQEFFLLRDLIRVVSLLARKIDYLLDRMNSLSEVSSMEFGWDDVELTSKATGEIITMADFSLANDQVASIPIVFKDAAGVVVKSVGGSATSSDPTIATVAVSAPSGDDMVVVTPVKDGEFTVSYTNAALPALSAIIDIVEPSATSDAFDFKNVVLTPKGP